MPAAVLYISLIEEEDEEDGEEEECFWPAVSWLKVGHMPVLTLIHAGPEIEWSKCNIWQLSQYCRVLTKPFSGFLLCKSESYWLNGATLSRLAVFCSSLYIIICNSLKYCLKYYLYKCPKSHLCDNLLTDIRNLRWDLSLLLDCLLFPVNRVNSASEGMRKIDGGCVYFCFSLSFVLLFCE